MPLAAIVRVAKTLYKWGAPLGWDALGRGSKAEPEIPFSARAFNVAAGQVYKILLSTKSGWFMEYSFSSNRDVDFRIMDPRGEAITVRDGIRGARDKVKISRPGEYLLIFDNEGSVLAGKDITCEYRVVKG